MITDNNGGAMTEQSAPTSKRGRLVGIVVGSVVVVVVAAVLLTVLLTRKSSPSSPFNGWGHDATKEVALLDLRCPAPLPAANTSATVAGCAFPDGAVVVLTSTSAFGQSVAISTAQASHPQCLIVGIGFVIGAYTAAILSEAVGNVQSYLGPHGAYTEGTC